MKITNNLTTKPIKSSSPPLPASLNREPRVAALSHTPLKSFACETFSDNIYTQNFSGYKGIETYGTEKNQKAMEYKILLTTQKIDEIMRSAKSTDEGLLQCYKLLSTEHNNISEAFRGMNVIIKHYLTVANKRKEEIIEKRPYGSKIPLIGLIPDYISQKTGGFANRIQGYTNDLVDDFNDIITVRFHQQLNKMVTDYKSLNDHFTKGIEYINDIKGESDLRQKIYQAAQIKSENNKIKYNSLYKNLTSLRETLTKMGEEIILKQNKNQNTRIMIKSAIKLITAGLG